MALEVFLINLLPKSYSSLDQAIALTVIKTSVAITLAMLLLVLYWVFTKSLETSKTPFVMMGIMILLAICIGLEINGRVSAGAWALVTVTVLLNFSNMLGYGTSTSASAGYIIPILLAFFCLGPGSGYAVTAIGCVFVFVIPTLHSKGWITTILPYRASNITFDAPTLSLIYLLTALIAAGWSTSMINIFMK